MASYSPFHISDSLTVTGNKNLHNELVVVENTPYIVLVLRLLSGSVKLRHNYSGKEFSCKKNYFSSDFKNYGQQWKRKFPLLISEDITADDIGEFVSLTKYKNVEFYRNILSEISYYLYSTKKGDHTSAFIYIYRLLEKISYAFPLIYASRTQDFNNSFNELKSLMVGDSEKKELGFFKKFVKTLYDDDPISETSIDIHISVTDLDVQEKMFTEMRRILDDSIVHGDTSRPNQLSINFNDMGSFIITIRNRFFHNMNGGANNIKTRNIADADVFFESFNDLAMHWLATIFIGVVSYSVNEFEQNRTPDV